EASFSRIIDCKLPDDLPRSKPRPCGGLGHSIRVAFGQRDCVLREISGQRFLAVTFIHFLSISIEYPFGDKPMELGVIVSATLLVGISFLAILRLKREPWFATGWFWFLGTLVPVIGLVQVGNQAMADRYTYIPFIGIFIVVVWSATELLEGRFIVAAKPD